MFLSEAPNGWHVLNVIPEFSDERNERTSHAKPPDDEEHDDLDGLERLIGAPQPLKGDVGLGVHEGVQYLAKYPSRLQPVCSHVKHILQAESLLNLPKTSDLTI